jgi:tRNA A37 threonylcarbamoyladenosine modification protein TsaB
LSKLSVDIIAVTISKPLLVGVYKNGILFEEIKKEGMTSDILPEIFDNLLKKYEINRIIYSKGPGSYMSIKLSYVFFKTLEITRNIELYGAEGFVFNNNAPIKAAGNSFFVKKDGIISIEKNKKEGFFKLPQKLEMEKYSKEVEPLYILKAV